MPDANAFQRGAFQRSAFQVVYSFRPVSTGGVKYGGGVTARFRPAAQSVHGGGGWRKLPVIRHIWRPIVRVPRSYRPRCSGGFVIGGESRMMEIRSRGLQKRWCWEYLEPNSPEELAWFLEVTVEEAIEILAAERAEHRAAARRPSRKHLQRLIQEEDELLLLDLL